MKIEITYDYNGAEEIICTGHGVESVAFIKALSNTDALTKLIAVTEAQPYKTLLISIERKETPMNFKL